MTAPRPRRTPVPDPYKGMSDEQVLAKAQGAYRRSEDLPPGLARMLEWRTFDRAMAELMRRGMMSALWKIHERENGHPGDDERVEIAEGIVEAAEQYGEDLGQPDVDL